MDNSAGCSRASIRTRSTAGDAVPRPARARLDAGERVPFDALSITCDGLEHTGRKLPWSDLQSFVVKAGELAIAGRGGAFAALKVADVPNFKVLRALVDERAGH